MSESISGRKIGLKANILSIRFIISLIFAAVVIYIFLGFFSFRDALAAISRASWPLLLLALIVFYASLPLRGARWGILLKPSDTNVSVSSLTHYYFLAWFANAILPARIGDIYRAFLLKKNENVSIPLSLGVLFSERVFDLAVTAALVVLSGSYFWAVLKNSDEGRYLLWGILATIFLIIIFALGILLLPHLIRLAPISWKEPLQHFQSGIFKTPALLPLSITMTLVIWLSEALRLYIVFLALGVKSGFLAAVFISQASLILMSIPLSPAGLGLVELLMLRLLASSDISLAIAGAVTIADRLISYWSLVIFGTIAYILSPRTR